MKAYLVLDFSVRDWAEFQTYISAIPAFIEKHGGRYIVRGVEPAVMEGDWAPDYMVILEFPSSQTAKAFLDDSEAQALFAVRHRSTDSKLVLGPVGIHREWITAAERWIMAEKLRSVLSLRMAMRLNSLSLQKKFSMRCRHL